jgi:competence protein ComEC
MNPLPRLPFLKVFLFLVTGILLNQYADTAFFSDKTAMALLSGAGGLAIIHHLYWRSIYKLRWIPGIVLGSAITISGFLISHHQTPQTTAANENTIGVGKITTVEYLKEGHLRLTLHPEALQQPTSLREKDKLLLLIQGPLDVQPKEGDRLFFKGSIRPLPTPSNPDAFNYGQYLRYNGYSGQAFLKPAEIFIEPSKQFEIRFLPIKIRNKCLHIFRESGVSENALVIIQALLLGDRSGMSRDIKESFIKSGSIHLLAVSGLHVGILYMIFGSVLSLFLKPSHGVSLLLSLGFLFFFAFITGFAPSVSRAAVMFAVIHIGRAANRDAHILNTLAVSASLLLVINPLFLFHAGFWLSHLAVLGIITFYPPINHLFHFRFIVWRHIWSLIAVSVAAQITTLPVSLYIFGAFPTWFLLSNLLMLPLVAPILLLAIATLLFSFSPLISTIFAGGMNDLLIFMAEMAVTIEGLPGGYLEYLWLSFPLLIISYIAIHQMGQLCFQRNGKYLIGFTASLLLLTGGLNIQWYHKLNSEQLVVYATRQGLLIDLILNGQVLTMESENVDSQAKNYARNAYIKKYRTHQQSTKSMKLRSDTLPQIHEINLGDERLLLLYGAENSRIVPTDTHQAQVLIIGSPIQIDLPDLIEKTNCNIIVAASSCPPYLIKKWKKETENHSRTFFSIKENGAFIFQNR